MIYQNVVSECCEAPIRLGHRKVQKTNKKVQIWICVVCKKRDVGLLPVIEGKVVRKRGPFADDDSLDTQEQTGYDRLPE